ncbi:MAG: cell division protein ZapA [Nitrospirota bacterium]
MPEIKNTDVEVFGCKLSIKGDADPEYVRQLARFVDERMRTQARKSLTTANAQKIAILVAINIADDLFRLRKLQEDVDCMIQRKTGDLFDLLEQK